MKEKVNINIEVPRELHKETKLRACQKDMSLKEYVLYCIKTMNQIRNIEKK